MDEAFISDDVATEAEEFISGYYEEKYFTDYAEVFSGYEDYAILDTIDNYNLLKKKLDEVYKESGHNE